LRNQARFLVRISSPYPALGPDPKNLISFAIFIKAYSAVVFNVPEKLTISSRVQLSAANLFAAGLKGNFCNFFYFI
jgi:hypothetical protein